MVLGAGVTPATQFLPTSAPIARARDGSIVVDPFLQAGHDIYAAGDVANFPYWLTGDRLRVEHWNNAIDMGRIAAKNMYGSAREPFAGVPFFSSFQVRFICLLRTVFSLFLCLCCVVQRERPLCWFRYFVR